MTTRTDPIAFHVLDTLEALNQAEQRSTHEPVVLFKHSTFCGLSALARRQLLHLTEAGDPPVYEVIVQQARSIANAIEERLGIRHETPQVIVLRHRQPVFHTSHRRVTADAVRQAIANEVS